jgi:hypothetical protein
MASAGLRISSRVRKRFFGGPGRGSASEGLGAGTLNGYTATVYRVIKANFGSILG